MGFSQARFRLWVLVAFGFSCVVHAQVGYQTPLHDHQYKFWQPSHTFSLLKPRVLQAGPVFSADEPIPVTDNIATAATTTTTSEPVQTHFTQTTQKPAPALSWEFPVVEEKPKSNLEHFGARKITPARSVAVKCGEKAVLVEVKQDFFDTGRLVEPSSITLGECVAGEVDSTAGVLVFQSDLEGCNSLTMVTDETLVYVFSLVYNPQIKPAMPIVRTRGVAVQIECHYARKHNVSSNDLKPTWIPFAATSVIEDFLVFTLQLKSDDWKLERTSAVYFLGEVMNIEASVMQFNHVPLRVFVDNCVASGSPNANADPRYTFIENHGCFTDGAISNSSFLPRQRSDKLRFQLEAFQFQEETVSIYITCLIKATAASAVTDIENKACSFKSDGWASVDGKDEVCRCCTESCALRKSRDLATDPGLLWEGKATIGPFFVEEL